MKGPALLLGVLAVLIWFGNTAWISSAEDTLPILIALPLFVWLGWPWKFKEKSGPLSKPWIAGATLFFIAGFALGSTFLCAIGWTTLLWTLLEPKLREEKKGEARKLLLLPLLAFPWISLDAQTVGWWFRLSGAWVTAKLFTLGGADVMQQGTFLTIDGLPVSVEAACAGLNTLQSMLIAGSAVAFLILKDSPYYWQNPPLLILMAWLANTLRIVVLTLAALWVNPEFALGTFHTWGGWGVLMAMFLLCWGVFSFQAKRCKT